MSLVKFEDSLLSKIDEVDADDYKEAYRALKESCSLDLQSLGRGVLDVSGTGGSGISKFNTSTASAFVIAAAGVPVIKFGNRSATGSSGSKDFLDQLGVATVSAPDVIERLIEEEKLAFLNARDFYPELVRLAPARKRLGRPTILNFLGPLLNPVEPEFRLMGVSSDKMIPIIAGELAASRSLTKAFLVASKEGLDELDPDTLNTLVEVEAGKVKTSELTVFDLPVPLPPASLGTVKENVEAFNAILDGTDSTSKVYRSLVLNSAAGILVASRPEDRNKDMDTAIETAKNLIKTGAVKEKLRSIRNRLEVNAA